MYVEICFVFHLYLNTCSRGPNVMIGYWNNPKATEETITRDGWLKTGDLATLDKDGFVYIKDRG